MSGTYDFVPLFQALPPEPTYKKLFGAVVKVELELDGLGNTLYRAVRPVHSCADDNCVECNQ